MRISTGGQRDHQEACGLTNPLIFSWPSLVPIRAQFVEVSAPLGWSINVGEAGQRGGRLGEVRSFIGELYGPDLHAKRIDALAGAALGVMAAASLAVAMIVQALAQARGQQAPTGLSARSNLMNLRPRRMPLAF